VREVRAPPRRRPRRPGSSVTMPAASTKAHDWCGGLKRPPCIGYREEGSVPVMDGSTPEIVARFAAVLKQEEVREELERLFRSQWPGQPAGEMNLRVLKAHRRRCTFETSFGSEDPARGIIAKVYQADRSAVFAAMQSLVAAGFGGTAEFAIPSPLGYLSPPHVLVQQTVPGLQHLAVHRARPP